MPLAGNEAAEATDFDKVFKPFALKKGVKVAPINSFGERRKSLDGVEENPIVVLDDEPPLLPPHTVMMRSPPSNLPGMAHIPPSQCVPLSPYCKTASATYCSQCHTRTLRDMGYEPSVQNLVILFV